MNLDWNDLVNCSSCNVTISVRISSPGDDGAVAQENAVTSTSIATAFDALQQTLAQQAAVPSTIPLPPPPPAVPVIALPAIGPPAPPAGLPVVTPPSDMSPPPAATADDTQQPVTADAPEQAPAAAAPAATPTPPAVDTTPVPVVHARHHTGAPPHAAVTRTATAPSPTPTLPTFAPPPPPPITPAQSAVGTAAAEVESVAAPTDAGRRIPRRAPPPSHLPPADGPYLGSAPGGQGSDGPPSSPAGLLALLVFLVPGVAQWLWANAALRPRGLRAGRPERPG